MKLTPESRDNVKRKIAYKIWQIFEVAEIANTEEGNWNASERPIRFFEEEDSEGIVKNWMWQQDKEDFEMFRDIFNAGRAI